MTGFEYDFKVTKRERKVKEGRRYRGGQEGHVQVHWVDHEIDLGERVTVKLTRVSSWEEGALDPEPKSAVTIHWRLPHKTEQAMTTWDAVEWQDDEELARFVEKQLLYKFAAWKAPRPRRKSGRPRDSQKSKLYAAERAAFDGGDFAKALDRFESVAELQAEVDRMQQSKWWAKQGLTKRKIRVDPGHGCRSALAFTSRGIIKMPKWSRKRWVLIHEVAHIVADHKYGEDCRHGRRYAKTYAMLIERFVGPEAARALKKSFVEHKVKYREAKKLTPEQKAAAAERFKRLVLKTDLVDEEA